MVWLVPFSSLSIQQQQAVQLDTRTHKAIIGGPGAGKTLVLVHRLAWLFNKANKNPNSVRLFVYTNTLKEFIKTGIDILDIPEECISTFDKWCKDAYIKFVARTLPNLGRSGLDFDAIRYGVYAAVDQGKIPVPIFDFVMLDEAQDLEAEAIDFLKKISRHITVCMDGKQKIFDSGATEAQILKSLGLTRQNAALLAAYRCNPMVTQLASRFIIDDSQRREFLNQAANKIIDRSKPVFFLANNFEEEKNRLIQLLRLRLTQGDSIAVLFPQQRQVFGFAEGMSAAGIEVEVHKRTHPFDFTNRLPKLMSYHQAKGLTFDSVFMPHLVNGSFPGGLRQHLDHLLFVGASRAVKWTYLSGINGSLTTRLYSLWQEDTSGFLEKQISEKAEGMFLDSVTTEIANTQGDELFGLD